jgi:hypothetical protein
MDGAYSTYREIRNANKILVEKSDRKRALGRRRREDNIKMNFMEMEPEGVD